MTDQKLSSISSAAADLGSVMDDLIESLRASEAVKIGVEHASPDSEYDDIVALATAICGVPIAVITIIDHRQLWIKAAIGAEFPECFDRNDSLCNIAIAHPKDITVVYDADKDSRCELMPFYNGTKDSLKFYAGLPLVTPQGYAVGTICVCDYQPRDLSPYQLKLMEKLRRLTVNLLVSRRLLEAQATKP